MEVAGTLYDGEIGCRCARRHAPYLTQLAQICVGLLQPIGHAHVAVHHHRGGEILLGLLRIARAATQFAEAQVAVWALASQVVVYEAR